MNCQYTNLLFYFTSLTMKTVIQFNVHVTVHRVTFLTVKPTRSTNFSNFFLEWNSTCFGQFLCSSSGVFQDGTEFHPDPARKLSANLYDVYHCRVYSEKLLMMDRGTVRSSILILLASYQQTCMTYSIAVCTVRNSWRWTEELSETCRVSFQEYVWELVHLVGFIIRNCDSN
jgi:hypothetical protein